MNQIIIYTICAEVIVMAIYEVRRRLRKRQNVAIEKPREFDDNYFFIDIRGRGCIDGSMKQDKNSRRTCGWAMGIGAIYDEQNQSAGKQIPNGTN